jgi:hypothetical protein
VLTTKAFLGKADRAIEETASELSSLLRDSLTAAGWPFDAAMSVDLFYTGERFDYKFEGTGAEAAKTLEFGNEFVRPTAEVRKFLNKNEIIEKVYVAKLETQLGDLL